MEALREVPRRVVMEAEMPVVQRAEVPPHEAAAEGRVPSPTHLPGTEADVQKDTFFDTFFFLFPPLSLSLSQVLNIHSFLRNPFFRVTLPSLTFFLLLKPSSFPS